MAQADVFERMRADHRRVLAEIEALRHAGGARPDLASVRSFVALLEDQFATHMAGEDEVLFPALALALPAAEASLAPLRIEHRELRGMRAALTALLDAPDGPDRDEQVHVQVSDLTELLRIHIRKEEALVFRVAEQVLRPEELERLAERRAARAGGIGTVRPQTRKEGNP